MSESITEAVERTEQEETVTEDVTPVEEPVEGEEQTEEPVEDGRTRFNLKINGEEQELALTPDELKDRIQKSVAADQAFATAAEKERRIDEIITGLKTNPYETFQELGLSFDEKATEFMNKQYELANMTPEERRAYDAEQRAIAAEERAKKLETKQMSIQEQEETQAEIDKLTTIFSNTLVETGIPDTDENIHLMSALAEKQLDEKGFIDEKALAQSMKDNYTVKSRSYLENMSGEDIYKTLGETVVNKLNEHIVNLHKTGGIKVGAGQKGASMPPSGDKPLTWEERDKKLLAIMNGD
jgi:hypothetical protein